ncbi:MAG: T9SS type A sorting domain-containing protein [Bacteroidetes bacterium]|nr:T9SS type A sorting domain-containing protein [Bacteroidota bacterium]
MKSKLLVIILTAFGFTTTTAQGQWVIIDTLYSFNQCTLPFPYQTTPVFKSSDTAYYFFNFPNCSPSTNSGYNIFRTSDSFSSWTNILNYQNTGGGSKIFDMTFVNNNVGFLSLVKSGGIYSFSKTLDAGSSWNQISFSTSSPIVEDLFFTNADSGFAISNNGILYKYINDTIHMHDTINFTSCWYPKMFFTQNDFGYIMAGDFPFSGYHKILMSPDGGETWSIALQNTNRTFYDISFHTDSLGFLASDTGLYKTNDAGLNWTLLSTPFNICTSISIVDNNQIFVIASGAVYKTNDGGDNWNQQNIPGNCNPLFVKMINDSLGFIYARMASFNFDNLVLKTTNGGIVGYSEINEVNNQLIIQPNPCLEKCEITLPIEFINENFITIKLCNILGKTVEQSIIQTNHNKINLDLIGKTSGVYCIILSNGIKSYFGRIIVD